MTKWKRRSLNRCRCPSRSPPPRSHTDLKEWLGVAPLALVAQRVNTSVGAMAASVLTAAATAVDFIDLIWDELLAGHTTADTAGLLLNEWQNGGRLDLILDIIAADVVNIDGNAMRGTDSAALASALTTAQNDLDILTGADGAILLSGTQTSIDAIEADTNELQVDDYPTTIAAIQSDTDDIQTRLPATLDGGFMRSDIKAVNASAPAGVNLGKSALQIIPGACEATPSVTTIQTDLAESQDDVYIGRTVIFLNGTAQDEATDITDYTGSSGTLEVTALANAPTAGDLFIII